MELRLVRGAIHQGLIPSSWVNGGRRDCGAEGLSKDRYLVRYTGRPVGRGLLVEPGLLRESDTEGNGQRALGIHTTGLVLSSQSLPACGIPGLL